MAEKTIELLKSYIKQQIELGMPDPIFTNNFSLLSGTEKPLPGPLSGKTAQSAEHEAEHPEAFSGKRSSLHSLYHKEKKCAACHLGTLRNNFVFGAGNAAAPLMIIGEAPGEEEDRQGIPFVGPAGAFLTKMLSAINIDRKKDVFITNILKCRPPGNRNPEGSEILSCAPILSRQIEIIKPKVLLLLGRIAAHELLKTDLSLNKLRLKIHRVAGIPAVVTYHPAALLRNGNYKPAAWEDLKMLRELLKEMDVYNERRL